MLMAFLIGEHETHVVCRDRAISTLICFELAIPYMLDNKREATAWASV
jgi:hypothetical protein